MSVDFAAFTVNNPYFWIALSFFLSAALSWLLMSRPRKWWVLLAALAAAFLLFSLGGVAGFLAALAVKLSRAPPPLRKRRRK